MTVGNILKLVDETKPNFASEQVKVIWLSEVEARIWSEVFKKDGNFVPIDLGDTDRVLLADFPYAGVYRWWLYAMIDFAAEDYEKYQNDMQMFNQFWESLVGWYLRTHRAGGKNCCCDCDSEWGDPLCMS